MTGIARSARGGSPGRGFMPSSGGYDESTAYLRRESGERELSSDERARREEEWWASVCLRQERAEREREGSDERARRARSGRLDRWRGERSDRGRVARGVVLAPRPWHVVTGHRTGPPRARPKGSEEESAPRRRTERRPQRRTRRRRTTSDETSLPTHSNERGGTRRAETSRGEPRRAEASRDEPRRAETSRAEPTLIPTRTHSLWSVRQFSITSSSQRTTKTVCASIWSVKSSPR